MSVSSFEPINNDCSCANVSFSSLIKAKKVLATEAYSFDSSDFFCFGSASSEKYSFLKSNLITLLTDFRLFLLKEEAPSISGQLKSVTSPIAVAWPIEMWYLLLDLTSPAKYGTRLKITIATSLVLTVLGAAAIPRSISSESSYATHMPARSPCLIMVTGFLNIYIDLTFLSCLS